MEKIEVKSENITEQSILNKMEELRKFSHDNVTEEKLRHGARIALGFKNIHGNL